MEWIACESGQLQPSRNLAWEDALLESRDRGVSIFLLYCNEACVVIGRNQNPWREGPAGGALPFVRRKSGGGAVYHDGGNLNWSFLVPRETWTVEQALDFVASAVNRLGIRLDRDSRGALFLDGRKVCGTARRISGPSVQIHGTLLVDSNLDALRTALSGTAVAGDRSIVSVRSPVANLREAAPEATVETARRALLQELESRYGAVPVFDPARYFPSESWRGMEREHQSWQWIYGSTLPFSVPLGPSGSGPYLIVRDGCAAAISDREDESSGRVDAGGWNPRLAEGLAGRPFSLEILDELRSWAGGRKSPRKALVPAQAGSSGL
ncbi:MAG TPA: lipoate--protein ligase family protein [Magnetospirillaceae bacterium]|nr:lipoate--protein ligase family protein [Magnetospirillaceae bacterium]